MLRSVFVAAWVALSSFPGSWGGESYDQGYWTPTPTTTAWWTPSPTDYSPTTSSYTSYYTPTSTWTTVYTQNELIVTYTSYIPCPVTSTVIYYTQTCPQCCNGCYTAPAGGGGAVGTTTFTSYTTTTPIPVQTITSNGYIVVVMDTSGYTSVAAASTATVQFQVINDGGRQRGLAVEWTMGVCVALIVDLMVAL